MDDYERIIASFSAVSEGAKYIEIQVMDKNDENDDPEIICVFKVELN